jgi:AcrR family transcriptional regulator
LTAADATIEGVASPSRPSAPPARTPYPEAARELLRQTFFDAARDQLAERAWSEITMSDIAAAAGVSRQTLYKEFGNRNEFGLALVLHEGERFLAEVEAAVLAHTDDPRAAIGAALELFLHSAGEDPLVRIMLSDDGTQGLLPFVTTEGRPVVQWATTRLSAVISQGWPQARKADVALLAEALVRLAISYITTPSETPHQTAEQVADLLGPFIDRALGVS